MKALVVVLLVCVALALCQASVRRATRCTIANDCASAGACEDLTHHWSCIHNACECHTHGTATTPSSHSRPYEGSPCQIQEDCHHMHDCDSDEEHCYDGFCRCRRLDEHHHG